MAFLLRHGVLNPTRRLNIETDPSEKILTAESVSVFRNACQVVSDAQMEAEEIISNAKNAFEAECRRGFEVGLEMARREQAEKMIEHVSRTVDYLSRIETRMVDLVMCALQKIISEFDDTERVLIVVRNSLSVVRSQKQMTLRLHPTRVEIVRSHLSDLLSSYPNISFLDLTADARVNPGACILESEIGVVESSIDDQLEAIRATFARILGSR